MGYGLDLVRVTPGLDRAARRAAVARALDDHERSSPGDAERAQRLAMPPSPEQSRLADLLTARFPHLRVSHASADKIELEAKGLSTQVAIFENAAGIGMHPGGFTAAKYIEALRFVWDCLEILEREGSLATYDTQIGRMLDLSTDFVAVLGTLSGERTVKKYRASLVQVEESYANQLAVATQAGPAKPYSANAVYDVGDLVEHPAFGTGVVRSVAAKRATIQFATATKVMVSG